MIFITCVISSNEWIQLHEQASRSWLGVELSRGEVMRRLSLVGCDRIAKTNAEERQTMAEEFRESLNHGRPAFHGTLPGSK